MPEIGSWADIGASFLSIICELALCCSFHKVVGVIVVVLKLSSSWLLLLGGYPLPVIHLVHTHVSVVHLSTAHVHLSATGSSLHLVFLIHSFHYYEVSPINWPSPADQHKRCEELEAAYRELRLWNGRLGCGCECCYECAESWQDKVDKSDNVCNYLWNFRYVRHIVPYLIVIIIRLHHLILEVVLHRCL